MNVVHAVMAAPQHPLVAAAPPVGEFTLDVAADRTRTFDTLLFDGRRVADVQARIIEAQFRHADGSTILFLNDDTPFHEVLTILLVGPALDVRDRVLLGGAFTPGYLTYAYPAAADELVFCWHDLAQAVTIGPYRRWFGVRSGWLKVRELDVQAPGLAPMDTITLASILRRLRWPPLGRACRVRPRGRIVLSLVWLLWLSLRTLRLDRQSGRRRGGR